MQLTVVDLMALQTSQSVLNRKKFLQRDGCTAKHLGEIIFHMMQLLFQRAILTADLLDKFLTCVDLANDFGLQRRDFPIVFYQAFVYAFSI